MDSSSLYKRTLLIVTIALIAGVLIQQFKLAANIQQDLTRILRDIGQPALWRGANFNQNQKFANYIKFLNQSIPEDTRVILPPADVRPTALGQTPFMQFFLAPRHVINCTHSNCLDNPTSQNSYILIVDDFPGEQVVNQWNNRLMFDGKWGVLIPNSPPGNGYTPVDNFRNILEIIWAAIGPLSWLILLSLCGFTFTNQLMPNYDAISKISLGYGLGLSVYSLMVASLSLLGIQIDTFLVLAVTGSLLIISAIVFFVTGGYRRIYPLSKRRRLSLDIWVIWIVILGILSAVIAIGKGYHTTDSILLWGAKGYGIASDGSLKNVMDWGTNTVAYPMHMPILIASSRLLSFENLPGSKFLFSGYFLGLMLFFYTALLRGEVKRNIAGLGTLLIASAPIITRHSIIAYANLVMSFYLVSAILLLTQSLVSKKTIKLNGAPFLAGTLFVAAAWTRPEGLVLSLLSIILIIGITLIKRWNKFPRRYLVLLLSPIALYSIFWFVINKIIYTRPVASSGLAKVALSQIAGGNLNIGAAVYVIRSYISSLLTFNTWGVLGVLMIIVIISAALLRNTQNRFFYLVLLCGVLMTLSTFGMYYLSAYDNSHDISWWVSTGLDRMIFPGIFLLWFGGIGALTSSREQGNIPTDFREARTSST